jgi:hypothetical protein
MKNDRSLKAQPRKSKSNIKLINLIALYLKKMFKTHDRLLIAKLVINFPDDVVFENDTQCFQDFQFDYKAFVNSCRMDYQFFWVCERRRGKNPKYHILLFFDGGKMYQYGFPYVVERIWNQVLKKHYALRFPFYKGLVEACNISRRNSKNYGLPIECEDPEDKERAWRFCKTLAKLKISNPDPIIYTDYSVARKKYFTLASRTFK